MALSEADTRAKLIDPAIYTKGWSEDMICRETTLGAVEIIGGKARRRAGGRTDYTLRVRVRQQSQPVAVALIEAKKETLPPGHGLDQAKGYLAASRHNVLFVFSSNGYQFVEFDRTSGMTTMPRPMSEFPSPADLRARYERIMGFSLDAPAAKPLLSRYPGGEGQRRYFQDAAIRAVLERVAHSQTTGRPARALLSLATGTGKTFIACNLLKRIADAGQLKRALFLCDRDELRTQGLKAMQALFGNDAAEVYEVADGRNHAKNARVHVATYQTLGIDRPGGDPSFLFRHYPENYFTHIIIDECHRSAWGKWSVVLTRNANAVQIGLTATPRQIDCHEDSQEARADAEVTADNVKYFGEPVYEYGLAQAMEDGYLAACEIQMAQVNLDATGLTAADIVARNPRNAITGQPLTAAEIAAAYEKTDYEATLLLPDRVNAMCLDLFTRLLASDPERGPHQKTIIFCARDRHADDVAVAMNNLYAQWCASKGVTRRDPYAFKCTAAASGNDALPDFRGSASSHFIATTVELLTTGVVAAQTHFAYRTSATQVLFLQHIIEALKSGGRCGMVIDEGVLFRTNEDAFVKTKRKLTDECDLWCVLSLPGGVFSTAGAGVKTNLLFFTKGRPTEHIWYYDLSDVKVGKKAPLTLKHFEDFLTKLPARADSDRSWTIDLSARRSKAAAEALPFRETARAKLREAHKVRDELAVLKKAKPRDEAAIAASEATVSDLLKPSREATGKADDIENAVYDLKAVNPHRKPEVDRRTPAELLDLVEAKGVEIAEALKKLRGLTS